MADTNVTAEMIIAGREVMNDYFGVDGWMLNDEEISTIYHAMEAARPPVQTDGLERWSLQFSNIPPAIMIWSARPGHDPHNNSIACCQFEKVKDRKKHGNQFRAIVAAHNATIEAQQRSNDAAISYLEYHERHWLKNAELTSSLESKCRAQRARDQIEALSHSSETSNDRS
jgi:hypothetical protein